MYGHLPKMTPEYESSYRNGGVTVIRAVSVITV